MPSARSATSAKIAPSILAADLLKLASEIHSVEQGGADWHHVDVMDGHFVPNLSFGLPLITQLKKVATIPLDVHIMVSNPDAVAKAYVQAGADQLSFHVEAATHPHRLIQEIQGEGAKAGVALNPGTPLVELEPLLETLDFVLVMSVNPGFGGQTFIEASLGRLAQLRTMIAQIGRQDDVTIAIDGGITSATIGKVFRQGAQAFIAGSAVYGAPDRRAAIAALRHALLA